MQAKKNKKSIYLFWKQCSLSHAPQRITSSWCPSQGIVFLISIDRCYLDFTLVIAFRSLLPTPYIYMVLGLHWLPRLKSISFSSHHISSINQEPFWIWKKQQKWVLSYGVSWFNPVSCYSVSKSFHRFNKERVVFLCWYHLSLDCKGHMAGRLFIWVLLDSSVFTLSLILCVCFF